MDPMIRVFLKTAVEAIYDAGLNPSELEGSKTGVFIGACFSESEKTWFFDRVEPQSFAFTGCERSMIANRLSYFLKLKGPSYVCDTACSSSLYALENAFKAIRSGECERAIVGGTQVCLHPYVSLQFKRLGVLSMDGSCKAFDNSGNGYCRSETVSAVVLQKAKDAKRIYATILHAKTNCDGYKDSGITFPSREMQLRLLKEFYHECSIPASKLSFLEAHGTGTKVGDPEELSAIEEVFANHRNTPLLLGSVKSNVGHTEPSAGMVSLTKALIGLETGFIPPNLHYNTPRAGVKSLHDGRLRVVTEKMPFVDDRGLVGINCFGFGGANCHVLIKQHKKEKIANGQPKDNLPRIVCISGRTKEAVESLIDDVVKTKVDAEYIRLLQDIFRLNIKNHLYRGYTIVSKSGEVYRSVRFNPEETSPLVVGFGIIDDNVRYRAKELLKIPVVAETLQRIDEVLQPKSQSISNILQNTKNNNIVETVLANLAIQIIFADILDALNVIPSKLFGINMDLSMGLLASAYFDKAITLREAVECGYAIAQAMNSVGYKNGPNSKAPGVMVAESEKNSNQLEKNLANILLKPIKLTKRVILGVSVSVSLELTPSFLIKSFGSNEVLSEIKGALKNHYAVLEIGNGNISEHLKKELSFAKNLLFDHTSGGINDLLVSIGRLYEKGLQPQVQNLYPKIQFPVSRGTPMISPKIRWNHSRDWLVTRYSNADLVKVEEYTFTLTIKEQQVKFMEGHIIDGRNLIPATEYLYLVWQVIAKIYGVLYSEITVIFENCKFKRACTMPTGDTKLELRIMIQLGSGNFEIAEGGSVVCLGRVMYSAKPETLASIPLPVKTCDKDERPLTTKDVYKELRLRGYDYRDKFKSIKSCHNGVQVAQIKWENWVTYMDNMLQMKILQEDSRMLYVPTSIRRLVINAKDHLQYVKQCEGEETVLDAYAPSDLNMIRSGGIEITGLNATSITKRKYRGTPILEKYVFVPNTTSLKANQAIRVNMQILLENLPAIKVKAVELVDEASASDVPLLGDMIFETLGDIPLIQPDITILSKTQLEVSHVKVEDKKLLMEVDCSLVVGSKLLQRPNVLQLAFGAIKENGFILSRESLDYDVSSSPTQGISVVTVFSSEKEKLMMFRKATPLEKHMLVKISSEDTKFTWVPELKKALSHNGNVLAYSQGEPLNGSLGLINCVRREPGCQNTKVLIILNKEPSFHLDIPVYQEQLKKNLAVNVFKDNQWGTYRHLLLEESSKIEVDHCYLNSLARGDLSSLTWLQGPLKFNSEMDPEHLLVSVYYASLNFRDVMTASGRINVDAVTRDRREQECVQGFEFSGRTSKGKRVMGMVTNGACTTLLEADSYLCWEVPPEWTLQDAATVPVVYFTCLFSLIKRARMKCGDTILIHSGTGGIGQAAINLALHMGCTVYTTVGTEEKREFIKKRFPQIKDKHLASSRDTNFEQHIMKMTNGRGVDVVLNSLAEEKLYASVRCLARGGRFVEIGKFDLANDSALTLMLLEKEASFHGLMLDSLFNEIPSVKTEMVQCFNELLKAGAIRPLNKTIFKMEQVEEAFRYMGSGKHMGKVLIEVRKEEKEQLAVPPRVIFKGIPRYYCDKSKSYIICGGLGGFGLELADWLVLRGCRKLVLNSRRGIRTGYQQYRIAIWRSYGAVVHISTDDITTYQGCENLINSSNSLGPVHAIFNLAVVLRDALLENQNEESFQASFGPKAYATIYLDEVTRKLCPDLRDFVIFSSVSCGLGNAGQTNYGMANSVMEKICEKRRSEGLPGLAIEWGAVGDVGLVADMQEDSKELEIGGTLQQRISNCLEVMDTLLKQKEAAIVSSMVVAEKRAGSGGSDNIIETIANILGIKDIRGISLQATLAEIGMDSMTAVEVKQTLEREFEVFLTAQDIKTLTFAKLVEIQANKEADSKDGGKKERALVGVEMILRLIGEQSTSNLAVLPIDGKSSEKIVLPTVVLFPGIEGIITLLEPLYKNIEANLIGLQLPSALQRETIEEMAEDCLKAIEKEYPKSEVVNIVCYSFGGCIALQVVHSLEEKGYSARVICIDGAPGLLRALTHVLEVETEEKLQVSLLVHVMSMYVPYEVLSKYVISLYSCTSFDERLEMAKNIMDKNLDKETSFSYDYAKSIVITTYYRLQALVKWTPNFKLQSKVIFCKPKLSSIDMSSEDCELSKICEHPVDIRYFEGNHVSILDSPELANLVNEVLGDVESV